ncbi:MAG: class B sortase [Lachnospiraceae bacterium]|nr:class B sortase [Lachnospiraceae bacterium]
MGKHVIYRLLMALLVFVFIASLVQIINLVQTQKKEESAFDELQSMIEQPSGQTQEKGDKSGDKSEKKSKKKESQEIIPDYEKLYNKNKDFIGWIAVDGTNIDYPVMYTPNNEEYYLHRSFNKKYSYSGVPFLGYGSDLDGSNIIVYGHHMKNGTMFADLVNFQKESYRKKHAKIIFDTMDERRIYEVVAAFPTTVAENEPFRYYEYTGKLSEKGWKNYLYNVHEKDETMPQDIPYGGELITLSTCAYHTKDGRFVVVGKLVDRYK